MMQMSLMRLIYLYLHLTGQWFVTEKGMDLYPVPFFLHLRRTDYGPPPVCGHRYADRRYGNDYQNKDDVNLVGIHFKTKYVEVDVHT